MTAAGLKSPPMPVAPSQPQAAAGAAWPISVILPCFRAADKVARTLEATLAGQDAVAEVVVVDGASGDATAEVVADFDQRFPGRVRFLSERDKGVYDAMNKGIGLARGRYLYFIGAGDLLRPGVLGQIATLLPPHDRALVYGDVLWDGAFYGGRYTWWRLTDFNLCHQAAFYGRELFERHGLYDLRYRLCGDFEFNLRLFGDRGVEKRHVPLLVADYEGGGMSATQRDDAFVGDFYKLVRRHLGARRHLILRADRGTRPLRAYLYRTLGLRRSRPPTGADVPTRGDTDKEGST